MQLNRDGEFKFIMHYQDLHMKLSFLQSLKSERPQEVDMLIFLQLLEHPVSCNLTMGESFQDGLSMNSVVFGQN